MKRDYRNTIGKRIRLLRQDMKIQQNELAEIIGMTQSHLSQIERGVKRPTAPSLAKIAKALNTTVDYLLMLEDDEQREPEPESIGYSEQAEEAARIIDGLVSTAQRQYCLDMIRLFVGYRGDADRELIDELGKVASDVGKPEAHSVAKSILENQRLGDPAAFLDTTVKRKRPEPLAPIN